MRFVLLVAGIVLFVLGAESNAAYIFTPLSNGQSSLTVNPGDSFVLDLVLASDTSDQHTVAEFDVVFSRPGLRFNGYVWNGSHANSGFDNSDPLNSSLPVVLSDHTRGAAGSSVDVHFDNFTTTPFTSGTLVSMNLTVPSEFVHDSVTINAVVIAFEGDSGTVATSAGPGFTLTVPEPSSMAIILSGLAMLGRRKKRYLRDL